jgi:hypothetical protein
MPLSGSEVRDERRSLSTGPGYRREAAKRAIRELHPDGIAVSADQRDDAVNGWLVSHSFPKVSRKTIQRALKDLDSEAPAQ